MGGFALPTSTGGGTGEQVEFEGKITKYVVLCAIIAATGGLMFGYDIGISGIYVFLLFNALFVFVLVKSL